MFQDPSSVLSALFSSDLEDIPKGKNAFSTFTCPRWPDFRPHNTIIAVKKMQAANGKTGPPESRTIAPFHWHSYHRNIKIYGSVLTKSFIKWLLRIS
jgi:hypothetical protein